MAGATKNYWISSGGPSMSKIIIVSMIVEEDQLLEGTGMAKGRSRISRDTHQTKN